MVCSPPLLGGVLGTAVLWSGKFDLVGPQTIEVSRISCKDTGIIADNKTGFTCRR
jgi:hypothetical protein